MERICDLYRILGDSLDLDETLSSFDRELRRAVQYEAISVHLVESGRVVPAYVAGESFTSLISLETSMGCGFLEAAVHTGRSSFNIAIEKVPGLHTALILPLERADSVTSVVALYHRPPGRFSDADLALLETVAPKLAAAIENARTYQSAAKAAGIDPVTGALNARSMFQRLDAELARTRRRRDDLGILQCTVEGLDGVASEVKKGVLRRIATNLRERCREYDSVAWTGDHFVLILVGLTARDFEDKRLRLQSAVEEVGFVTGLPLSISQGAAFFPHDATDAEGLLAIAAERLRLSKSGQPA